MSSNIGNKNPDYVARGLKAAIHNENVSDEAKVSAAQRLENMGADVPADFSGGDTDYKGGSNGSRQRGKPAQTKFGPGEAEEVEEYEEETPGSSNFVHAGETNRVLGGYKATLKNPNVCGGAKKHAKDVLGDAYN